MAVDEKYVSISLMPIVLNRNKSQNRLEPFEARILQNCDVLWMEGRLRRSQGFARTEWPPQSSTPLNGFASTRKDCRVGVIWHDAAGNIKICYQNQTAGCIGPLPLWKDDPTQPQLDDNGGTGGDYVEDPLAPWEGDY